MNIRTFLITAAWIGLTLIGVRDASAGFTLGDAGGFAVLGQFPNSGTPHTAFNNGTIVGDIGIGSPRDFTISNAILQGDVRFSGAASTSGVVLSGANQNVFGSVVSNDPLVTSAINTVNALSQTMGGRAGTDLTLTSSQTILASNGILDVDGNRVFDTTDVNLNNSTILTINGSASDYVVINVTDNNPAFNGQIVLTGGITSDHVLFNMYGGNYTTHTGGPTLTLSTNGQITTGIFLDPNGGMQMNNTILNGRFFGGDSSDQQIVSGAYINAPSDTSETPEPGSLVLLGTGMVFLARRLRRR